MTTYKGVYIPANAETGWGPLVNANWTLLADREEVIRKTSAESVTSSTTLQNDNELVYTMEASHTWAFKLVVSVSHAAAAVGLKAGFTGPASSSWSGLSYSHAAAATSFTDSVAVGDTASMPAAGRVVTYEGIVTCGVTAGNFQYQWAQSASNGTALIVATNSYLLMKLLV
jgi:hypothetical protein